MGMSFYSKATEVYSLFEEFYRQFLLIMTEEIWKYVLLTITSFGLCKFQVAALMLQAISRQYLLLFS
jgi:hypothetical protein